MFFVYRPYKHFHHKSTLIFQNALTVSPAWSSLLHLRRMLGQVIKSFIFDIFTVVLCDMLGARNSTCLCCITRGQNITQKCPLIWHIFDA